MSDVHWEMLSQYPDAGAAFAESFQQGMKRNQEQAGRNALAKLVMNPSDQQALSAAAQYDPGAALQVQQSQQRYSQEQHQQWAKYAGELAKWATDPQKWDQAIDYIVQAGHPEAAQLKGKFSPALRANFMAQGGIQDDNPNSSQVVVTPQPGAPAFIYDKATGQMKQIFAPNPGDQTPGAPVSPPTATGPNGQKIQFNPQSGQWEPMGGAGGNASGGFPAQ